MVEVGVKVSGKGWMDRNLDGGIQDRRMNNIVCEAVAGALVHLLGVMGRKISTLGDLVQHLEALLAR